MNWSLTVHIIGIVLWIGGLLIGARVARMLASAESPPSEAIKLVVRKIWNVNVLQGLALVLLTGLYQLFTGGLGVYMKQGWFHGKMTLLLVLLVTTGLFGAQVRAIGEGRAANGKRLVLVQVLTIICLVGIVTLSKALRVIGL